MPWSMSNLPPPAKNWTEAEQRKCIKAGNAVLRSGGSDEEAIYACIHAAGKSKKEESKTMDLGIFMDSLLKVGARHGKRDKEFLQKAHDHIACLVDGGHCASGDKAAAAEALRKAGARHSSQDIERIKKAHDLINELGALCPGPDMPMMLNPKEQGEMPGDEE